VSPATAQAADGTLLLHARDAFTHGETIRYESTGGKDNIGYWTNPADWVSWDLRIGRPGSFDVEITYACPDVSGGSRYVVGLSGEELSGKVQGTGSWTAFETQKLGTVKLSGGRFTLTVKAKDLVREGVMNLQSIVLRPAK